MKNLNFVCPSSTNSIYLYILSDTYYGLDQEYQVNIDSRNAYLVKTHYKGDFSVLNCDKPIEESFALKKDLNIEYSSAESEIEDILDQTEIVYDNW